MKGIKIIIAKELSRVFKDRKMIFSMFILPLIIVIGVLSLVSGLINKMDSEVEAHQSVVSIVNAPKGFVALAMSDNVNAPSIITEYKSLDETDYEEKLKEEIIDLVIVFPEDFESQITDVKVPNVEVYYNPSEDNSSEANYRFSQYLEYYKSELLVGRFGNLNSITMFTVENNYVQDEQKAGAKVIGMMLPYFITLLIFAGAMGLGVDMIAGEKERGTMAAMLLTPIKRTDIVLGKVFSLAILAVLSAAVHIVAMVVAVPMVLDNVGGGDALSGLSISFSVTQIVQMAVVMIGIVLLYISIICTISVFNKTVKEATSFISPVYMLVLVAGMITMYSDANGVAYKYMIPVYGSSAALKDILMGTLSTTNFIATSVSTYAIAIVLVLIMTKAFNSEKVMFGA